MSPNGIQRSEKELQRLDELFSSVGPLINSFAEKIGSKIEKYEKGAATWVLRFSRKQGGVASITIGLDETSNEDFYVVCIWFVDDYEAEMRHARDETIGTYNSSQDSNDFSDLLKKALETIKSWDSSDLNRHDGPMKQWKKNWSTREAFERADSRVYPVLDI